MTIKKRILQIAVVIAAVIVCFHIPDYVRGKMSEFFGSPLRPSTMNFQPVVCEAAWNNPDIDYSSFVGRWIIPPTDDGCLHEVIHLPTAWKGWTIDVETNTADKTWWYALLPESGATPIVVTAMTSPLPVYPVNLRGFRLATRRGLKLRFRSTNW